MVFLLTVKTCVRAAPPNFKHDFEKKTKTFKKIPSSSSTLCVKRLDYMENSAIKVIKAEDLSDVQDVPKKQIRENTLVSPRILAFID